MASKFLNRIFQFKHSAEVKIGHSLFMDIIKVDDRYLGIYCMICFIPIGLNWDNPAWNAPMALSTWFAFTVFNLVTSQFSIRFNTLFVEAIRTFVTATILFLMFSYAGGVQGNFWYGFLIMCIGATTAALTYGALGYVSIFIFTSVYIFSFVYAAGGIDNITASQAGTLVGTSGGLALVGIFIFNFTHFLLISAKEVSVKDEINKNLNKSQESLRKAKHLAEQASQYKSEFLASLSHEIRTPLTAISGFSEILENENHTEEQKLVFMKSIQRNCDHLTSLISDILDLSKIEAGKTEPHLKVFNLKRELDNSIAILNEKAKSKGNIITVSTSRDIPEQAQSDPLFFRQILINVLSNSIKFTENGQIDISLVVEDSPSDPGRHVLKIEVTDSGSGIPVEDHEKIFDPFFQSDSSAESKHEGTGLGLALSRKFARLLGGDICVAQSEIGKGTTILIRIPFVGSGVE